MVRITARPAEHKALGITLILLSTFVFAGSDLLAKLMLERLPPVEVFFLRSVFVVMVTLPLALWRVGRRALFTEHPFVQGFRGVAVVSSSLLFLTGLSTLPLAEMSAINFVWPLLITVFSVPILGEKIGIRRWSATFVGFCGMLLIVRPGSSAFQHAALYPLGAAVLWAFAVVITRRMAVTEPPETTLAWSALVALFITSLIVPKVWIMPNAYEIGLAMLVGIGSSLGHGLVVYAYERANAAALAPFSYLQLVWAVMFGYLVYSTIPDAFILSGAALIVGSGIYTAHRERVKAGR